MGEVMKRRRTTLHRVVSKLNDGQSCVGPFHAALPFRPSSSGQKYSWLCDGLQRNKSTRLLAPESVRCQWERKPENRDMPALPSLLLQYQRRFSLYLLFFRLLCRNHPILLAGLAPHFAT
jgi:hypothetical protein